MIQLGTTRTDAIESEVELIKRQGPQAVRQEIDKLLTESGLYGEARTFLWQRLTHFFEHPRLWTVVPDYGLPIESFIDPRNELPDEHRRPAKE